MKSFIRVHKIQFIQCLTSFMSNGLSHPYQLDESITLFKGCSVVMFIFIQILKEFNLILYIPVNNFSVMSERVFLGLNQL